MSVLTRFEGALEALFEGGARRLFRPRMQPVEVIRALERAMGDRRVVLPGSVLVPNRYEAHLNPIDHADLAALNGTVEREAVLHLEGRARDQGWRTASPFLVVLKADRAVGRSRVRTEAFFDEIAPVADRGPLGQTTRIPSLTAPPSTGRAILVDEQGRQKMIEGNPVSLGRALDNDLVIRDLRVSRHHAVLDPVGGSVWLLRDLQSSNGTFVEGQRVDEKLVEPGCWLSLGGYRLFLRKV